MTNRKYCILCKNRTELDSDGVCKDCRSIYNNASSHQSSMDDSLSDLLPGERRIVNALTKKMDSWKAEILSELHAKDEKIESLNKDIKDLKNTVSKLKEQIDNNDAYERRDCLIFSGSSIPVCRTGENSTAVACELIKSKLNFEVSPSNISTGHRLGNKSQSQEEDRRPIILKFCRREIKSDILKLCKENRPQNLYVNESLTPLRSKILYVLRLAKRNHPNKIASCKSLDGKVVVWVKPPRPDAQGARNTRVFINSKNGLEKFLHDLLEVSLQDIYDGEWPR